MLAFTERKDSVAEGGMPGVSTGRETLMPLYIYTHMHKRYREEDKKEESCVWVATTLKL